MDNIFSAWHEFKRGKRNKKDVLEFEQDLEQNLFQLYHDLASEEYQHGPYQKFSISDPKPRVISKAAIRDRIVHHLVSSKLREIFEPTFIYDSYSSRCGKGTHEAVKRLNKFCRSISRNNKFPFYALKCDVEKFFDSVDHEILLDIIKGKIGDERFIKLLEVILESFWSRPESKIRLPTSENDIFKGIPLGNVTSQHFANLYLNELDRFIKHRLKETYYLRYTDDFIILANSADYLKSLIPPIESFLSKKLKLKLHQHKIIIRKNTWGVDFLGYIILPKFTLTRTKTKNRILRKIRLKEKDLRSGNISLKQFNSTLISYLGHLSHAKSHKIKREIKRVYKGAILRYNGLR